ncbi:transposase [Holospora elegans]|nr:transposase [Holospora elegans]
MRTLSFAQDKDRVLNKQRWDIERLFRTMKTQGVNLENTPMKDLGRLSKLMTIVAVAILYAFITALTQECAYKKTVRAPFYSSLYSYFTRGLRWIKDKLLFFDFRDILNYLKKSEGEYGQGSR